MSETKDLDPPSTMALYNPKSGKINNAKTHANAKFSIGNANIAEIAKSIINPIVINFCLFILSDNLPNGVAKNAEMTLNKSAKIRGKSVVRMNKLPAIVEPHNAYFNELEEVNVLIINKKNYGTLEKKEKEN